MEGTENQETRSKIIKKKGSQFTSKEDARAFRAVQRKMEQKQHRTKSLANRRFISTPQSQKYGNNPNTTPLSTANLKPSSKSLTSTTKKYSKTELHSLGKIRYENMLLWKKEKTKLIENEKKKRKPAFVAGVYKPDAPKFLAGSEESSDNVLSSSLLKSASKNSVKKGLKTPAYHSVDSTVKAKVYKPLHFHSGMTPHISSCHRMIESKNMLFGKETKTPKTRSRVSRAFRPPPNDLGISPLPATPASNQEIPKRLQTNMEPFAPMMFNFEAPSGLKFYNLTENDQKPEKVESIEQMKRKLDILMKSDASIMTNPKADSCKEICYKSETVISSSKETEHAHSDTVEIHDSSICNNNLPLSTLSNGPLLERNLAIDNEDSNSNFIGENSLKLSDSETEEQELVSQEGLKLVQHAGRTPARRKTKSSIAKLTDSELMAECITPSSRLRPRTTCSRSTRRSQIAHCDHSCLESLLTPANSNNSTKKRRQSRKSLAKSSQKIIELNQTEQIIEHTTQNKKVVSPIIKVKFNETPTANVEVEEENSKPFLNQSNHFRIESNSVIKDDKNGSPFKTPISHLLKKTPRSRARVSNLLDTSPWINKSRGSASSQGKERRSIFSNELESMFNDLPLDFNESIHNASLLHASPDLTQSTKVDFANCSEDANSSFKENMTPKSELIELLKPSTHLFPNFGTPALVWGPDSPSPTNTPCPNEYPPADTAKSVKIASEEVLGLDKLDREPLVEIPSTVNLKKTRRNSRKISVSFANDEMESGRAGSKYPVTPRRPSSSDSGSILSPLVVSSPNTATSEGDLLHWDSPIVYKSGPRRKSQAKSLRISLLPGLESLNEQEEDERKKSLCSSEPVEDLISFDTPTNNDTRNKKRISKLDTATTPARRSKRVSHVAPD